MRQKLYLLWTLLVSYLSIHIASAQNNTVLPVDDCIKTGTCGLRDIPRFIQYFASYLVGIGGTISVIMMMVGGYQYIIGGVTEEQKNKGKKTITYAIIGLIISSLSWVIINVVQINLAG